MKIVKVYTTPVCPFCKMIKQFLKKNSVEFTEFNVRDDVKARNEMMKISGQSGVPVIQIGDEVIIGFNEEALRQALNLK